GGDRGDLREKVGGPLLGALACVDRACSVRLLISRSLRLLGLWIGPSTRSSTARSESCKDPLHELVPPGWSTRLSSRQSQRSADRPHALRQASARADGRVACVVAVARHRLPVRAGRCGPAQAANDGRGATRGGDAGLLARPWPRREPAHKFVIGPPWPPLDKT